MRFQDSPSWLTPSGVAKKRRLLERKGLPDFKGRRFITLTIDKERFDFDPLAAYLAGKDRIRRFLESGRKAGLWERGAWWCWKLEFHKDGWPHWHLIMDRVRKFTVDEMRAMRSAWGLGRTNCRRIAKSKFGYQFKYAFKGVFQDDSEGSGLCVPQWFLDYFKPGEDGERPDSFGRVRFWQTSKGFYTGPKVEQKPSGEKQSSILPRPAAEILHDRQRGLLVCARERCGRYRKSGRFHLTVSYQDFIRRHLWDAEHGAGCTLSARSFCLDPQTLIKLIENTEICRLELLRQQNRMSLKRALLLRRERVSLETF